MTSRMEAFHGWKTVCGGFCIHLVLGTLYLWGNVTTYVTAYLRKFSPEVTYNDTLMVFAIAIGVQGSFMTIGGIIESRLGAKYCCLLGGYILVSGIFLSSLVTSLSQLILTNGVLFGMGVGICYSAPITAAARWMPTQKGLISGVVVAGFGFGAFIFGMVSLAVVNPQRIAFNGTYYQSESEVVAQVPNMYRSLALCYFVLITVGSLLLSDPPKSKSTVASVGGDPTSENVREEENCTPTDIRSLAGVTYTATQVNDVEHESKEKDKTILTCGTSTTPEGSESDLIDIHSMNLGPLDIIRIPLAWHLASCFITTTVGGMYLCGTYKTYGKMFFGDEKFLSLVGSTSSIFSAAGRIFWGAVGDRIGSVEALMVMSFLFSIVTATYALSPNMGEFAFATWTYAIFFFEGNQQINTIILCFLIVSDSSFYHSQNDHFINNKKGGNFAL